LVSAPTATEKKSPAKGRGEIRGFFVVAPSAMALPASGAVRDEQRRFRWSKVPLQEQQEKKEQQRNN
jgi:hypothetical protein